VDTAETGQILNTERTRGTERRAGEDTCTPEYIIITTQQGFMK